MKTKKRKATDNLTQSAWAARLVRVGVAFVNESERILGNSPKDAIALAQAGAVLVNANCNWAADVAEVPHDGGLSCGDLMLDPAYMDIEEMRLARITELQMARPV